MTGAFIDTSAFLKLFIAETGSSEMRQHYATLLGHNIFFSGIARVESMSATARSRKAGMFSGEQASAIAVAALQEIAGCHEVAVSPQVLEKAGQLADKHELRALDSIQLACALHARKVTGQGAMQFISADALLLRSAALENFITWNPCDPRSPSQGG